MLLILGRRSRLKGVYAFGVRAATRRNLCRTSEQTHVAVYVTAFIHPPGQDRHTRD